MSIFQQRSMSYDHMLNKGPDLFVQILVIYFETITQIL